MESHPRIEHLNLNENEASASSISAISLMIFSECNQIRKLDLGKQRFRQDEKIDIAAIAFALEFDSTLLELNLSFNSLQDQDISALAASLEHNMSLQKLLLHNNSITDHGVQVLASALPKMRGLKEIWLHNNLFGSSAANALIDATRRNLELERAYIAKTSDHSLMEIQKHINYNLCLNMGGRRLLKAQDVCPSLWPLVFERAVKMLRWGSYVNGRRAQADVIFYLLQGPALFERKEEGP